MSNTSKIEYENETERLNYRIMWLFVMIIITLSLMWIIGSQMVYIITIHGNTDGIYMSLVLGIFLTATTSMLLTGVLALRARKRWGDDLCQNILGIDSRILTKSEVVVIWSLIIGTILGIGVWDFTVVICALIANMFDLSVFYDDYIFIDFIWWTIHIKLWMFFVSGTVEVLVSSALAISIFSKVENNTFCEVS